MTCEIFAFPAERSKTAHARNRLNGRTENDFRAKARPLSAKDLPDFTGTEYAEARLRDAARVYADTFGPTAAAVLLGSLISDAERQASA